MKTANRPSIPVHQPEKFAPGSAQSASAIARLHHLASANHPPPATIPSSAGSISTPPVPKYRAAAPSLGIATRKPKPASQMRIDAGMAPDMLTTRIDIAPEKRPELAAAWEAAHR